MLPIMFVAILYKALFYVQVIILVHSCNYHISDNCILYAVL